MGYVSTFQRLRQRPRGGTALLSRSPSSPTPNGSSRGLISSSLRPPFQPASAANGRGGISRAITKPASATSHQPTIEHTSRASSTIPRGVIDAMIMYYTDEIGKSRVQADRLWREYRDRYDRIEEHFMMADEDLDRISESQVYSQRLELLEEMFPFRDEHHRFNEQMKSMQRDMENLCKAAEG
ncbi:hypothetical protein K461DRAFT_294255 [Myriangium duriaei CBS 260.36]|uniref:Uncharacterized protein n=1 Tax=Myriangium duriaei CBS 260.36 TaxID=1168546 RepID=A0A9P4IZ82_9PEZI|nr:hypothetical protein K461DRAFT_294255 [Myriangium duriaei CBS 260.36]